MYTPCDIWNILTLKIFIIYLTFKFNCMYCMLCCNLTCIPILCEARCDGRLY